MTSPTLNLLVLRCRDIEATRQFYGELGIRFSQEQHGTGPVHYAAELGGLVLELYPTKGEPDNTRLGFKLGTGETCRVLTDPDGREKWRFTGLDDGSAGGVDISISINPTFGYNYIHKQE